MNKVFCCLFSAIYLVFGILYAAEIVSSDMLSIIAMLATCGLVLNEIANTYKKHVSEFCKVLQAANIVIRTLCVIVIIILTLMYFSMGEIGLFCPKGICLLPIVIAVIAAIISTMKKGKSI